MSPLSWLLTCALTAAPAVPPATVAEKSDYKATSKHAEVVAFCEELVKQSPLVKLAELGTSHEGRKLPLVILADPPVATPADADAAFVGQCPGVIGPCCHGPDEVEGYRQLCEIVEDWVTLLRQEGRPLPPATAGRNVAGLIT